VSLKGAPELKARLNAVRTTFKGYGRTWADDTASEMRRRVPVRTGHLRSSIRRRNATQKRAVVVGDYTANFVDAGSKAHDIKPKNRPFLAFDGRNGPVFAKKVHKERIGPRRFKRPAALAALRKHPIRQTMIDLWNRAA
jgi:hypothetical protein